VKRRLKRILLFSSSRNSSSTEAGLRLLHKLSKPEDQSDLVVVLMQDTVLLALKNFSCSDFTNIPEAYVLDEHLRKRGFTAQSLRSPFKPAGFDEIVELIMKEETHVIGSF
jgi:sulfur relay protein TusB/DsrH